MKNINILPQHLVGQKGINSSLSYREKLFIFMIHLVLCPLNRSVKSKHSTQKNINHGSEDVSKK